MNWNKCVVLLRIFVSRMSRISQFRDTKYWTAFFVQVQDKTTHYFKKIKITCYEKWKV